MTDPGNEDQTITSKIIQWVDAAKTPMSSADILRRVPEAGDSAHISAILHSMTKRGQIARHEDPKRAGRWLYTKAPDNSAALRASGKPAYHYLRGDNVALDTAPPPPSTSDTPFTVLPDHARLTINSLGELTMDGTTFDAATTRELGMFLTRTLAVWGATPNA